MTDEGRMVDHDGDLATAMRVRERVLGASVVASVPRVGEKPGMVAVRPSVPVPRWSDVPRGRSPGVDATVEAAPGASAAAVRARSTRRTLLLAAARRFAALGYHGTSVAEILGAAGADRGEPITKGALYFHFSSKHDLGQALVDETLASWGGVVEEIDRQHDDPLWRVLTTFDAAVAMSMHDPVTRGAHRIRADHESFAEAFRVAEQDELDRLASVLHVARERRLLCEPADPSWTAEHVHTLFAGHRARSEDASGVRSDLWACMTSAWQALLPAVAADHWMRDWRAAGWALRPRPDPQAYRAARRPEPGLPRDPG